MVLGKLPFNGENEVNMIRSILKTSIDEELKAVSNEYNLFKLIITKTICTNKDNRIKL